MKSISMLVDFGRIFDIFEIHEDWLRSYDLILESAECYSVLEIINWIQSVRNSENVYEWYIDKLKYLLPSQAIASSLKCMLSMELYIKLSEKFVSFHKVKIDEQ